MGTVERLAGVQRDHAPAALLMRLRFGRVEGARKRISLAGAFCGGAEHLASLMIFAEAA
jgi:hypothetical protein